MLMGESSSPSGHSRCGGTGVVPCALAEISLCRRSPGQRKHRAVLRVRKRNGWPFIRPEPAQFVVLVGCAIGHLAHPIRHDPDRQLEAGFTYQWVKPSERRASGPADLHAQLLGQLANQRVERGFTRFHMAAWKGPDAWVRGATVAPVTQKQSPVLNQSSNYHLLHPWKLITATVSGTQPRVGTSRGMLGRCGLS